MPKLSLRPLGCRPLRPRTYAIACARGGDAIFTASEDGVVSLWTDDLHDEAILQTDCNGWLLTARPDGNAYAYWTREHMVLRQLNGRVLLNEAHGIGKTVQWGGLEFTPTERALWSMLPLPEANGWSFRVNDAHNGSLVHESLFNPPMEWWSFWLHAHPEGHMMLMRTQSDLEGRSYDWAIWSEEDGVELLETDVVGRQEYFEGFSPRGELLLSSTHDATATCVREVCGGKTLLTIRPNAFGLRAMRPTGFLGDDHVVIYGANPSQETADRYATDRLWFLLNVRSSEAYALDLPNRRNSPNTTLMVWPLFGGRLLSRHTGPSGEYTRLWSVDLDVKASHPHPDGPVTQRVLGLQAFDV